MESRSCRDFKCVDRQAAYPVASKQIGNPALEIFVALVAEACEYKVIIRSTILSEYDVDKFHLLLVGHRLRATRNKTSYPVEISIVLVSLDAS